MLWSIEVNDDSKAFISKTYGKWWEIVCRSGTLAMALRLRRWFLRRWAASSVSWPTALTISHRFLRTATRALTSVTSGFSPASSSMNKSSALIDSSSGATISSVVNREEFRFGFWMVDKKKRRIRFENFQERSKLLTNILVSLPRASELSRAREQKKLRP